MIFNTFQNKLYKFSANSNIGNSKDLCIIDDLPQNIFNAHRWTNKNNECKHEDADINKVYISTLNELHVLTHDLCAEYTYHIKCNLDTMKVDLLRGFDQNNKLLYDGKLIYVAKTNKLMY